MTDVTPNLKALIECACGCGEGRPRVKAWQDGMHTRTCTCTRCQRGARGLSSNRNGHRRQRAAVRNLGLVGLTNEEREASIFANEVKSGKQTGPAFTWWLKAEAQIIANEPDHGNRRKPARVILRPDDHDGVVIIRESTWAELVSPALLAFYGEA